MVSITIPNSVTSIGGNAFYCCENLTSVTIPDSVTNIGYHAFAECKNLSSVTVEWTDLSQLTTGGSIFEDIHSDATLFVPIGTKSMYQSTAPWSSFKYIEEYDVTSIDSIESETDAEPVAIYTTQGTMVTETVPGRLYIYKYADGRTVKKIAK